MGIFHTKYYIVAEATEQTSCISIQDLSFYRDKRAIYTDLNLDIPTGKIVALMGPSGTGKTTLLRLISGMLKPTKGRVIAEGKNIHTLSRKQLLAARRDMGMMFQSNALFTSLSVFENIAFPLRVHTRLNETMITELVLMKLEAVGLRGAANLMPSELSGGMSRRVALARAIALDPKLMMYDEPFTGQDPISLGVLLKLIKTLNESLHMTSIIVSHNIEAVMKVAEHLIIVGNGSVLAQGSPQEILNCDEPTTRQFIQGLPDGPVPFHYPAEDFAEQLGVSHVE